MSIPLPLLVPVGALYFFFLGESNLQLNEKLLITIGVVQCCIFMLQLRIFGEQAGELKKTVEEMRDAKGISRMAAKAATRSAKASERSIEQLHLSVVAAQKSADASIKSADIAEKSLVSVERPYIFAMGVRKIMKESSKHYLQVEIVNYGKTPGFIEEVSYKIIKTKERVPAKPDVTYQVHAPIVAPSEKLSYAKSYFEKDIQFKDSKPVLLEGEKLFYWFIIKYSGTFSKSHQSCVCWKYNSELETFFPYEEQCSVE